MAGRHVGHLSTKKSTRQHGRQGSVEGTTLVPYCSQLAPWPPAGVISRGLTMMPPVLPLPFLAWQRSVRRQSSYSAHSAAVGATEGGGGRRSDLRSVWHVACSAAIDNPSKRAWAGASSAARANPVLQSQHSRVWQHTGGSNRAATDVGGHGLGRHRHPPGSPRSREPFCTCCSGPRLTQHTTPPRRPSEGTARVTGVRSGGP